MTVGQMLLLIQMNFIGTILLHRLNQ